MVFLTHNDTASVLIEAGGMRILTDPVFDAPGKCYHFGWGSLSKKSSVPAFSPASVGSVDLVLLSHDQHGDNLDTSGREFLSTVPRILTTEPAARRLKRGEGMKEWQTISIGDVRITAVPARHGPRFSLPIVGKVLGFVLETEGETIYISGDTVYFAGVSEVARRFKPTAALLHIGGVGFPYLTGPIRYTFNAREAVRTAAEMQARTVIPIHYSGWSHFRESTESLKTVLAASSIAERVRWLKPGERTELGALRG
jgi:L-ascorbate metabolism protein UlaG (beta-lactamase superfamily)